MKALFTTALVLSCIATASAFPAISNFSHLGQIGNVHYYQGTQAQEWGDADRLCRQLGGHLACIGSAAENTYLATRISTSCWIGFNDFAINGEGNWQWISGEPVFYTHWAVGQPDDANTRQDFARLLTNGNWDDYYGVGTSRALLEISFDGPELISPLGNQIWNIGSTATVQWTVAPAYAEAMIEIQRSYPNGVWETVVPNTPNDGSQTFLVSGDADGRTRVRVRATNGDLLGVAVGYVTIQRPLAGLTLLGTFGGHEYYYSTAFLGWYAARNTCLAVGGHLVTINSQEEDDFIFGNLADDLWTGFNDIAQEGTFVWESGEPVTYTGWAASRPDNAGNQDAAMNTWLTIGAGWDDHYLDQESRFLLELDPTSGCIPALAFEFPPNNPDFPGEQSVSACVTVDEYCPTALVVPVNDATNIPLVTITPGCELCDGENCQPLYSWSIYEHGWVYFDNPPRYVTWISNLPGQSGGCVCVSLDFVLPVTFNGFAATVEAEGVLLDWSTGSESFIERFELNRDGELLAQIPGENDPAGHQYSWLDTDVSGNETHIYELVCVELNGTREVLGQRTVEIVGHAELPREFTLHPVYPNPFNPATTVGFDLPDAARVVYRIYNVVGAQVAVVDLGLKSAGSHSFEWNAGALPSGLYFGRIEAGALSATHKLVLMK